MLNCSNEINLVCNTLLQSQKGVPFDGDGKHVYKMIYVFMDITEIYCSCMISIKNETQSLWIENVFRVIG